MTSLLDCDTETRKRISVGQSPEKPPGEGLGGKTPGVKQNIIDGLSVVGITLEVPCPRGGEAPRGHSQPSRGLNDLTLDGRDKGCPTGKSKDRNNNNINNKKIRNNNNDKIRRLKR